MLPPKYGGSFLLFDGSTKKGLPFTASPETFLSTTAIGSATVTSAAVTATPMTALIAATAAGKRK
jgi:hypothetical protein